MSAAGPRGIMPRMFLRSVRLENVRSLAELELDFAAAGNESRRWTLVLGENGCGKSTILRAIALVLAGTEALPELLGDPDGWIGKAADAAAIEVEIVTKARQRRRVRLVLQRGVGRTETLKRNAENLAALDAALAHAQRSYLVAGYGVSRRLTHDAGVGTRETQGTPRSRAVASLFTPDAQLQSLESWAMDLEYRHGKAGLALVKEAIAGILPGVEFAKVDRQQRVLLFKTQDGLVPLARLSDGYQHVAAWVGDLLYRITETFGDYRNPLAARGLLLIDELELHLHPLAQRRLRAFLDDKLPNFQIVATTHSALTAQQAEAGELFYLRRDERSRTPQLHAFAADPQKLFAHQLLLSDAFGVTTLQSPSVERMRERYLELRDRKKLGKAEAKEFAVLVEELRRMPDWTKVGTPPPPRESRRKTRGDR